MEGEPLRHITIGSMMDPGAVVVSPDRPTREVVALMAERRLSCVVVCDGLQPIGVLSKRDLVRVFDEASRSDVEPPRTAFDVLSFPPFTLRETDSVQDAMNLLSSLRRAPAVDSDGTLIGIVHPGGPLGGARPKDRASPAGARARRSTAGRTRAFSST
jgi:CBS domain-containing protein